MAGNWMDERDRMHREREGRGDGPRAGREEDRTWERDRVFGERESGVSYGRASSGGYRSGSAARGWQDPRYGGVSPAMRQGGGYGRGRFPTSQDESRPSYTPQDYRVGGRFYGDDDREFIYREEYGQGGVEYGDVPTGYDAGSYQGGGYEAGPYSPTRARYHDQGFGQPGFGGYAGDYRSGDSRSGEYRREMNRPASGGTGGYDYERGYGDAGRRESRGDRSEDSGRHAGEFLHRAGEKVASWFTGGGESRIYDPHYLDPDQSRRSDSRGLGARDLGARGLGPSGYKRSDDRISDDAHERLTDDAWLDASNISVSVSGGEVTLSGTVDTREAKHHAERLVEDLSGVTHVQNNLRIAKGNYFTSPTSGYGDSVLGAQIRAADAPDPAANGTGGAGGGQSTAGRKN
jgi:osmotically-inducible protein OsmY